MATSRASTSPISDFLVPEAVATLDAAHRGITIRHLLTMTSGLQWQEGTKAESDGMASFALR